MGSMVLRLVTKFSGNCRCGCDFRYDARWQRGEGRKNCRRWGKREPREMSWHLRSRWWSKLDWLRCRAISEYKTVCWGPFVLEQNSYVNLRTRLCHSSILNGDMFDLLRNSCADKHWQL